MDRSNYMDGDRYRRCALEERGPGGGGGGEAGGPARRYYEAGELLLVEPGGSATAGSGCVDRGTKGQVRGCAATCAFCCGAGREHGQRRGHAWSRDTRTRNGGGVVASGTSCEGSAGGVSGCAESCSQPLQCAVWRGKCSGRVGRRDGGGQLFTEADRSRGRRGK